jgi:TonB family protein
MSAEYRWKVMQMKIKGIVLSVLCLSFAAFLAAFASCAGEKASTLTSGSAMQDLPEPEDLELLEDFDTPPTLILFETPKYPEEAKKNGIEGTVVVKVDVDADGSVSSVKVLRSSNSIFDSSALISAKKCRFEPAKKSNRPVSSVVALPINFKLTK